MDYIVHILLEFIFITWKIRHFLKSVDSISQIIEHYSSMGCDILVGVTALSLSKLTV